MRRPRAALAGCALAALLATLARPLAAALQEQRWRSGESLSDARAAGRRVPRAELVQRLLERGGRHALVRFERPLTAHERALWRAAGIELGTALGGGAYLARCGARAFEAPVLARLPALNGLVDVRPLELGWKLDPALLAGETPSWIVAGTARDGAPLVALDLVLQADVALARGAARVAALGGRVLAELASVNGIVALLPRDRVSALAALDEVAWVEPALPRLEGVVNNSVRARVQADQVQAAPYGLDGSGVTVLVYDEGTARATHQDFGGRLSARDGTFVSSHATHCAATIGGDGSASAGLLKGMAPGVLLESYGYEDDGTGLFLFSNPGDLEHDYGEAITLHGADLASNSIGTNVESNGFLCTLQGDYGVLPQLIDAIVRGSLGAPFPAVWAGGNERNGGRCQVEGFGEYYSVAPPATAKNGIYVGALNSNDDTMTSFSSWGPTDDGRLKPDLCAPGCQSNSDGGVTSASSTSDTSYATMCGTSMAAPTVAGVLALLLQDWRARYGAPDPRCSTLKALLAQTAVDLGNTGPDYQFGYGSIRAKDALDFMRLGRGLEAELDEQGARRRYTLQVGAGDPELKLTLCWDDFPASPSVFGSLVNDLDLVVFDPAGQQHPVWTLDPGEPSAAAVRSQADRLNTIEQVFVSAPAPGSWTVEVRAHLEPAGPQVFSLVSSHPLSPAPCVRFSFPDGLPVVLTPGVPTDVRVRIETQNDGFFQASPRLHVRYFGPAVLSLPMSALGGGLYRATLPPPSCRAVPAFGFSARGLASGRQFSPEDAPRTLYHAFVADEVSVFADDFESDRGWSVVNDPSLQDGPWERGVPAGTGARGDPLEDYDHSGRCYLTDNVAGNSDVEGGPTRLVSPRLDLANTPADEIEVSYAYWFSDDRYDADELRVELSNDDGASWTTAEVVTSGGNGEGWALHSFLFGDFLASSSSCRVRFSVSDPGRDSITEAALDAFRVVRRDCGPVADCNRNGILDADDIAAGRSLDANGNGVPDECEPADHHDAASRPTITRTR